MYYTAIRYFFINLICIQTFYSMVQKSDAGQAQSSKTVSSHIFANFIVSIVITGISTVSYTVLSFITPVITVLCMILINLFLNRTAPGIVISNTFISYGISYALYTFSVTVTAVVFFRFPSLKGETMKLLLILASGLLCSLFAFFLLKSKRVHKLLSYAAKGANTTLITYVSLIIIVLYTMSSIYNLKNEYIYIGLIILILFLAIFLFFNWKREVRQNYTIRHLEALTANLDTQIAGQSATISKLEADNDALAKIVHRDNKLIPAMIASVESYLETAAASETGTRDTVREADRLLENLKAVCAERVGILDSYCNPVRKAPVTGIVSTDSLMTYMMCKALDRGIEFDFTGSRLIPSILALGITQTELNTLLADLTDNAIIAVSTVNPKKILIEVAKEKDLLSVSFYDTGIPFSGKVLKNIGKKRITTYRTGNGIGLVSTFEFLRKYKAAFILTEYGDRQPCPLAGFTKKITISFTGKFTVKIISDNYPRKNRYGFPAV